MEPETQSIHSTTDSLEAESTLAPSAAEQDAQSISTSTGSAGEDTLSAPVMTEEELLKDCGPSGFTDDIPIRQRGMDSTDKPGDAQEGPSTPSFRAVKSSKGVWKVVSFFSRDEILSHGEIFSQNPRHPSREITVCKWHRQLNGRVSLKFPFATIYSDEHDHFEVPGASVEVATVKRRPHFAPSEGLPPERYPTTTELLIIKDRQGVATWEVHIGLNRSDGGFWATEIGGEGFMGLDSQSMIWKSHPSVIEGEFKFGGERRKKPAFDYRSRECERTEDGRISIKMPFMVGLDESHRTVTIPGHWVDTADGDLIINGEPGKWGLWSMSFDRKTAAALTLAPRRGGTGNIKLSAKDGVVKSEDFAVFRSDQAGIVSLGGQDIEVVQSGSQNEEHDPVGSPDPERSEDEKSSDPEGSHDEE